MLWAQSTTKDYIGAEDKLQSISKLFIPQVIISQVFFAQTTAQIMATTSERKTRKNNNKKTSPITHDLVPSYIPRALNTGTCIQQGELFYSAGLTQEPVVATADTRKTREVLEKCGRMHRKGRN